MTAQAHFAQAETIASVVGDYDIDVTEFELRKLETRLRLAEIHLRLAQALRADPGIRGD